MTKAEKIIKALNGAVRNNGIVRFSFTMSHEVSLEALIRFPELASLAVSEIRDRMNDELEKSLQKVWWIINGYGD